MRGMQKLRNVVSSRTIENGVEISCFITSVQNNFFNKLINHEPHEIHELFLFSSVCSVYSVVKIEELKTLDHRTHRLHGQKTNKL